ncbi:MAG: YbaB/EbfC family nucleoid-associated protein [Aquihabitans sp.]
MADPDDQPVRPDAIIPAHHELDGDVIDATEDDQVDIDGIPSDPLAAVLGGGGFDFGALMEQASQMQSQMLAAQEQAADALIEGVAGGGAVRITLTGTLEPRSVVIDPAAVDPNDVEMLQDLVLAALRHAVEQANDLQRGSMDLGGLDLGGLFGS